MFVHLVLIRFKPGVTRADPRVPAWEAKFKALHIRNHSAPNHLFTPFTMTNSPTCQIHYLDNTRSERDLGI